MRDFRLSDTFIEPYKTKEVKWGPTGEFTYLRTYSRRVEEENRNEAWWETVRRVVEGTFSIQKKHCENLKLFWNNAKAQKSAQIMFDKIFNFKFLPPGRGLWAIGTKFVEDKGSAALNNPLHVDTQVLTKEYGWARLGDFEGQSITVLSNTKLYGRDNSTTANPIWVESKVSNIEIHPTKKITYTSKFGDTHSVIASDNHRWFRTPSTKKHFERVTTLDLKVGDYLPRVTPSKNYKISQQGIEHGFFFGDGTRSNGELHQFGEENIEVLNSLFTSVYVCPPLDTGVSHSATRQCPYAWGEIPQGNYRKDKRYLYGFLAGYFAADGTIKGNRGYISSSRLDELESVKEIFSEIGIRTSDISLSSTSSNFKEDRELYVLGISLTDVSDDFFIRKSHKEWAETNKEKLSHDWLKIVSIEDAGENEVLCATVPKYEQFVIEGYCLTSNCGFISTEDIDVRGSFAFTWTMDALMLGVGIGFDTKGANKVLIKQPKPDGTFVIPDSREGWVESLHHLLEAYLHGKGLPVFDYSLIRPYGEPIRGFGGTASGPEPLKKMHENINNLLTKRIGSKLSSTDIVDIINMISVCVIAGNVRRSACIAVGEYTDEAFVKMKDYNLHPEELMSHRWASNNSIFAEVGKTDYASFTDSIILNGEPGIIWLDNMRKYSRTSDAPDWKDAEAKGTNPCFTGDTLIAVADGRGAVPIRQLAEEGLDVPVYSVNTEGKVEIKYGRNPRITGYDKELVKVTLDDGSTIRCTPNHKFRLLNGETVEAKDLQKNMSLSRFTKYTDKIKEGGKDYVRVVVDTLDSTSKVFEHRLVAKFFNPEKWGSLYDENKQSGWIEGGLVIHHKDYNGLNNSPENLEIMTFGEHAKFHGDIDNSGEKNGMYGKKHSEESKKLIGAKTKERSLDDEYRAKLSAKIKEAYANNPELKDKLRDARGAEYRKWCEKFLATTDLKTFFVDGALFVIKKCEECGKEFSLPAGRREQGYCSISCSNKKKESIDKRVNGQKSYFSNRQRETLHNQIMVFKDLVDTLGREPLKKEWEAECKGRGVSFRIRTDGQSNEFILTSFKDLKEKAIAYNHRVKSVEFLSERENVYNITVDDNHTIATFTNYNNFRGDGIFTFQCGEQTLDNGELCCLSETFPSLHESKEEYLETLKYAYLYAKTVTLLATHWPETNAVLLKNRRIGLSQSGIIDAFNKFGRRKFLSWCDEGYKYVQELDKSYSNWFCIPRSKKTTTVKPSGTVSLLPGVSPGIHYPHAEYYIRRIRVSASSLITQIMQAAGYEVEDDAYGDSNTKVVSFPVHEKYFKEKKEDVSIWKQVKNVVDMQRFWSDNNVSVTVTFKPHEAKEIPNVLEAYEDSLKSISFLPLKDHGYKQAPYEEITKERYEEMVSRLTKPAYDLITTTPLGSKFCDGEACTI